MKTICFSLLYHDNEECFYNLFYNVLYHSSNFKIYFLLSCTNNVSFYIQQAANMYENIHIVTIRNENIPIWGNIELFNQHILNINYLINNNIEFDYLWFLGSNELFIKHISEEYIDKYTIKLNKEYNDNENDDNKNDDIYIKKEYRNEMISYQNKRYKIWWDKFKKDTYTYNIFKDNLIFYQIEGLILENKLAFEICKKYNEYKIYNIRNFNDYALEEVFIQSYLYKMYNITEINYLCFRYLMMNISNENSFKTIESLYKTCYYHPYTLSIKPVNRTINDPLRQMIKNKMEYVGFILDNYSFVENKKYFSNNFTCCINIKKDTINFSKICKGRHGFCWFGYTIPNIGTYTVSFEIYSNKTINFDFIKLHKPIKFYNCPPVYENCWTEINITINIYKPNDLLCFIFDNYNDLINIKFKNIKITDNENCKNNINITIIDEKIKKKPLCFASGTCRLLKIIGEGIEQVEPLQAMFHDDFTGINFLGKLNNVKQHIQLINFINKNINIPSHILKKFLTVYNYEKWASIRLFEPYDTIKHKINNIKNNFYECNYFIFEISSIKCYTCEGFQVQYEQFENNSPTNCLFSIQSKDELISDVNNLIKLISKNSKIIFICHFRPNIIYNDLTLAIPNREIIYETLLEISQNNKNIYLYDPSILISQNHNYIIDQEHYSEIGYKKSFECIYDSFIKSKNVALIIPLHPKHYEIMYKLLDKNITDIIDVFIVFTNKYEYDIFKQKYKIKPIVLPDNFQTGSIVTYKKLYALQSIMSNINYDYFIVCDSEIDIINKNFNMNNILNKVESIFKNKIIYAGEANRQLLTDTVNSGSSNVFCNNDFNKLKDITNDFTLYYWWSDLPVYKREHLPDFFNKICFNNISWKHFDHIIYLNYLLLYKDFSLLNITPLIDHNWSLELYYTDNIEKLNKLKEHKYGFGWVIPKFLEISYDYLLNEGTFLIYHTDRIYNVDGTSL